MALYLQEGIVGDLYYRCFFEAGTKWLAGDIHPARKYR
jgi:hypothetical protein